MADESNVLFIRKDADEDVDDVWDDTALIKAYDKAVNLAKEEVSKRIDMETESSQSRKKLQSSKHVSHINKIRKKWTVGSPCRAVYSEDNEIYEAIITNIYGNSRTCEVKFIGYDNTEDVELDHLLESEGLQSQIAQKKDALANKFNHDNTDLDETVFLSNTHTKKSNGIIGDKMDCDPEKMKPFKNVFTSGSSFNASLNMMPPAPPLPPQLMAKLPENDADALSSMLMSWYISGFHTGYYHGLKHAKDNSQKRQNC